MSMYTHIHNVQITGQSGTVKKKLWVLFLVLSLFSYRNLDKSPEFLDPNFQIYKIRELED